MRRPRRATRLPAGSAVIADPPTGLSEDWQPKTYVLYDEIRRVGQGAYDGTFDNDYISAFDLEVGLFAALQLGKVKRYRVLAPVRLFS